LSIKEIKKIKSLDIYTVLTQNNAEQQNIMHFVFWVKTPLFDINIKREVKILISAFLNKKILFSPLK
jgi:hypothetical protein